MKGRDFLAAERFRERARSLLGKALLEVRVLRKQPLELPGGAQSADAPSEIAVLAVVERRDAWVEEQVDSAALDACLEHESVILPLVYTPEEVSSPLFRASPPSGGPRP